VDGGSSQFALLITLDATQDVEKEKLKLGKTGKWVTAFAPGIQPPGIDPVLAMLDLGSLGVFTTFVSATPAEAALDWYNYLVLNSFPDVELFPLTNEVAFLLAPSSEQIKTIEGFSVDSPGLHYSLSLPTAVPEGSNTINGLLGLSVIALRVGRRRMTRKRK